MKVLVVRLQIGMGKKIRVGHEFYPVIGETEENYEVDLALSNILINNKKYIPKTEVDKVKFVQMLSCIDGDKLECCFLDAYVYATIQSEQEDDETVIYWINQIKTNVMQSIKSQNQTLKMLYHAIEEV
jgi:hypothetical protein